MTWCRWKIELAAPAWMIAPLYLHKPPTQACHLIRVESRRQRRPPEKQPGRAPQQRFGSVPLESTQHASISRGHTGISGQPSFHLRTLLFPRTLDLSTAPYMARLRQHPIVVLSPHFDDACFSLGSFLKAIGHGTLVNVFTRGRFLAKSKREPPSQTDVFALRDAEDERFARECDLSRIDLKCKEPMLRDRRISDLSYIRDDLEQMEDPVLSTLAHLAADVHPRVRCTLFAPLGVGNHCNHRALNTLIINNFATISQKYEIMFYEELPYSSSVFHRSAALHRISRCCVSSAAVRYVFPTDWAQKRTLIEFYPSQLRAAPRWHRYRPAAQSPLAPHEAFWSLPMKWCA
jgi:hypothetical protein